MKIHADATLPAGATTLTLRFISAGAGKSADIVLSSGEMELARGSIPYNIVQPSGGGETLDIGRDLGVPVTDYRTPHGAIEGDIPHVSIDLEKMGEQAGKAQ
jgi:arylsulfatase